MSRRANDAYSVLWVAGVLLVFAATVILALPHGAPVNLSEQSVQSKLKSELQGKSFDPNNPPDFTIDKAEIVLSDKDGTPKLRLSTDRIGGESGVIGVKELSARFKLHETDELLIKATDCSYFVKGKEAIVEGDVSGEIPGRGQRFKAKKLSWKEESAVIIAHDVTMSDPQFETSGNTMEIDLATGVVKVSKGVVLDL